MKWNEWLRYERKSRGWTQKQLAEKIGTNAYTVNRWENGNTFPSPFYREQLSEIFGHDFEDSELFETALQRSKSASESISEHIQMEQQPSFLPSESLREPDETEPILPTQSQRRSDHIWRMMFVLLVVVAVLSASARLWYNITSSRTAARSTGLATTVTVKGNLTITGHLIVSDRSTVVPSASVTLPATGSLMTPQTVAVGNGVQNTSTPVSKVNLVQNPSFETGSLAPWTEWDSSATVENSNVMVVNSNANSGSYSVRDGSGPCGAEQVILG